MEAFAQARSSASVVPLPSTEPHSESRMGKNRDFPPGTVELRVALPTTKPGLAAITINVPPRNQTAPHSPSLQSAVSKSGWRSTGIEYSHFQCSADHSP